MCYWEEKDIENGMRLFDYAVILTEIFDIAKVTKFSDIKYRIGGKIFAINYPLWVLSTEGDEGIKSTFNLIKEFVTSRHIKEPEQLIHTMGALETLKANKDNFKKALREDNLKELYFKWAKKRFGENLTESDLQIALKQIPLELLHLIILPLALFLFLLKKRIFLLKIWIFFHIQFLKRQKIDRVIYLLYL